MSSDSIMGTSYHRSKYLEVSTLLTRFRYLKTSRAVTHSDRVKLSASMIRSRSCGDVFSFDSIGTSGRVPKDVSYSHSVTSRQDDSIPVHDTSVHLSRIICRVTADSFASFTKLGGISKSDSISFSATISASDSYRRLCY